MMLLSMYVCVCVCNVMYVYVCMLICMYVMYAKYEYDNELFDMSMELFFS